MRGPTPGLGIGWFVLGGADGRTPVPAEDICQAGAYLQNTRARTVAQEEVEGWFISTVFLGLDHQWDEGPPLLFETMIKDPAGSWIDYQERYSTWEEAEAGHQCAVEWVRSGRGVR